MPNLNPSQPLRYAIAVGTVLLALLLMMYLNPWVAMSQSPFLVFFGAVMLSAWVGGVGPGLVATFLSALLSTYFFIPPIASLALNLSSGVRVSIFLGQGILFSLLCEQLQTSNRRLKLNLRGRQESEERYRRLVETATEGIWTIDAEGHTDYVNQRMADLLGYSIEEMLDRSLFEFMDVTVHDAAAHYLERQKQGIGEQFEFRLQHKDGSDLWVLVSTTPLMNKQGKFLGTLAMFTDISERKRIEDALQNALQKLTFHVENSPLAVVEWDREYRTTRWSPQAETIFGWRAEEILGKNPADWQFVHPEDWHEVEQVINRLVDGTDRRNMVRFRNYTKDGSIVHCEWYSSALLDEKGAVESVLCLVLDVTARLEAEQALQNSEAQFRLVTNAVPSLIGYVDQEQRYRFVNQAYREWFEADRKLIGQSVQEVLGESTYLKVCPYIEAALSGQQVRFESTVFDRFGELHCIDVVYTPDLDEQNQVKGFVSLVIDITERKRAEMALEAANKRISNILESVSDAFIAFDQEWRYTYINDEAAKLLRRSRAELLGKQVWEEVFPEAKGNRFYHELHRAVAEQVTVELEDFSQILNRWLEVRAYPSAQGLALYFRDVSQRKQVEAAIRQSEERLQLALDAGKMGTWEWNLETNAQQWDAGQYKLFGTNANETKLNVNTFFQFIHPDDLPHIKTLTKQVLGQAGSFQAEFRIIQPNGRIRWLASKGMVVPARQDQAARMIGVNFDITSRKQAEAERERLLASEQAARREAESASRMKDEFLAMLSHELRSPLNAMLGWTTLLRSRQFDAATTAKALETIERNARAQAQLIEDLLDVSRIIRGQLRLDVQPVFLVPVIEAAIDTVRPAADAKNIWLQPVLDPNAGPIAGDPNRLQQIIWNLLSNAIKFTPKAGRVQIRLERINSHVEIVVSDNGKGINSDFLPYVFDRFRQADSSMTRNFGGLGLGLAIVRHLVELHGGTVLAESQGEGQGATFIVKLPLMAVIQDTSEPERVHPTSSLGLSFNYASGLEQLRILIVDDEADVRELLTHILQTCGATVVAATSVNEAVTALSQQSPEAPFDVLISDIGMPEADGYDLIRRVRALPPNRGGLTPALALTAYARAEDRKAALVAGFQAHVAKPIEPAELTVVIASLVGRMGKGSL